MKFQLSLALVLVALTPCNAVVDCRYVMNFGADGAQYGTNIPGLGFKIADMGAKDGAGKAIDMTNAEELKKMFPKCEWEGNVITHEKQRNDPVIDKWILPKCTGCSILGKISGAECDSCGYADICEQLCAKGKNCGQVHFDTYLSHGRPRTCQPLKVTKTCAANPSQKAHLQVGVDSRSDDLKTSEMGAEVLQVSSLSAYFPQCPWTSSSTKDKHWELKDCNKCGPKQDQVCTQCELAEICGMLCSQSTKCKHFSFHGNRCHPKAWPFKDNLDAKATHISGKPIKMCYTWTQKGVDGMSAACRVECLAPAAEYGHPAADDYVSFNVEAALIKQDNLKHFLASGHVKRTTCPEAMVTGHAASLQPLWVALVAMSWVGMQ